MAVASSDRYYCSVCDMDFPFKSKLDRHLLSDRHKMYAMCMQPVEAVEDCTEDAVTDMLTEPMHEEETDVDRHPANVNDDNQYSSDEDEGNNNPDWDMSAIEIQTLLHEIETNDDYSPFPNKIFAMLYCVVNSPIPFGESNIKFLLFILSQTCKNVPSLPELKKFKLPGLLPPTRHVSQGGFPFYMNSLSSIVQRCLGDVYVSKQVQRYPVVPAGPYREMYHASRWLDRRFSPPMAILSSGLHVFTRDCVTCLHPVLGNVSAMVNRFFAKEECVNELFAEIDILLNLEQYQVMIPDTLASYLPYGTLIVFETLIVPTSHISGLSQAPHSLLKWNSSTRTLDQVFQQDFVDYTCPNRFREMAAGRPVVMLPLVLFTDDTSGNRSKKWHKFDSWSVMLAGLPRRENAKVCNIHFICCSDTVSALDMAGPIAQQLHELEIHGIEAFDVFLNQPVLVVSPLMCVLADNPRASELLNHLGSSARRFCRMCMVDRDVNPAIIGVPRTLSSSLSQIQEISSEPLQRKKQLLRTEFGLREDPNPLLHLPADLYQSTPVESLHTILLGPYKYLLKRTIPMLSTQQKEEILARVRDFNYSGFETRLIGNVVQYHKSFVGRDYKAWAQMALSVIYPYLSDADKTVWMALSKVFKITYCEYYDPSNYEEWKDICKGFVDAVNQHRPDMMKKPKVHLILHLVESMEQFGPTSAFNTERCEAFNSYIRAQNIYSNKSAPSRDICNHFASIEQLRHVCSGGYINGRCGKGLTLLYNSPVLQNFLNHVPVKDSYCEKKIYQPGALRKRMQGRHRFSTIRLELLDYPNMLLGELSAQQEPFEVHHQGISMEEEVEVFQGVIGQDSKMVHVGDCVKLSFDHYEMKYGQLLVCVKGCDGRAFCLIRGFKPCLTSSGDTAFNTLHCPSMTLTRKVFAAKPSTILGAVSIIHDCNAMCKFVRKQSHRTVEREQHLSLRLEYEHNFSGNSNFYLNVYCIKSF